MSIKNKLQSIIIDSLPDTINIDKDTSKLEKNKLMAIKSLLPYKNIKNDCLYVDESSVKLLGTENKKVK